METGTVAGNKSCLVYVNVTGKHYSSKPLCTLPYKLHHGQKISLNVDIPVHICDTWDVYGVYNDSDISQSSLSVIFDDSPGTDQVISAAITKKRIGGTPAHD